MKKLAAWFLAAVCCATPAVRAQVVNDTTTNTLNNVTNIVAGTVTVGTNGDNTGLILTNGAFLTNSANGVIGRNAGANTNFVWLTGLNTRWLIFDDLYVGSNGAANRLVISNGALVGNDFGYIGFGSASSNNVVTVTGTGSVWSNRSEIDVGFDGAGNTLVISNGGAVVGASYASIGFGATSDNNLLVVTGAGSLWSNALDLYIGEDGANNTVTISAGGTVVSLNSTLIGRNTGSTNNRVTVTGSGSLWKPGVNFNLGYDGGRNQLTITNGGAVFNDGHSYIGFNATGGTNIALVTGSGSVWSNSGDLRVGNSAPGNMLIITNGGLVQNNNASLGDASTSSNNVVVVTGAGSVWSNNNDLFVGASGDGNTLLITNGGLVRNNFGYLGYNLGANSNLLVVNGSVWSNSGDVRVGNSGAGNTLLITNGGFVRNNYASLGDGSTSSNNVAAVTGAGSLWSNNNDLYVGASGAGNRLTASNGGTVFASNNVFLGFNSTSTNNRIITDGGILRVANAGGTGVFDLRRGTNVLNAGTNDVDYLLMTSAAGVFEFNGGLLITRGGLVSNGAPFVVDASGATPAIWDVRDGVSNMVVASTLFIGIDGPGNQLLNTNGQTLEVRGGSSFPSVPSAVIGFNATATNNIAFIAGGGSFWSNANNLVIGSNSAYNRLVISNGALVGDGAGWIGFNSAASNNVAVVTGGGSFWSNRLDLVIGTSSDGNTLLITNGGLVGNSFGVIGGSTSSSDNAAVVTGAGSLWSNRTDLRVGDSGSGNRLVVSNGGVVTVGIGGGGDSYLGFASTSTNNLAVATGSNSLWSAGYQFYVGYDGPRNQLIVSNGGAVIGGGYGYIGYNASSGSNLAVVTGAGSLWTNDYQLTVGNESAGNQLIVSNGGAVFTAQTLIGAGSNADNNLVLVAGSGSVLSNSSYFYLGLHGSFNRLVVSNGGVVRTGGILNEIGYDIDGVSNTIVITGAGSRWDAQGTLFLGLSPGNQLVVSNGGVMADQQAYMGIFSSISSNNSATITGSGSIWSNLTSLTLDAVGTRLLITNGGAVYGGTNTMILGLSTNALRERVTVDNGTLTVRSAGDTAVYDIRRGTNALNAGTIDVDQLVMTNALGVFEFNGGTLITRGGLVSNDDQFIVGANGSTPAIWDVRAGVSNMVVASNLIVGLNVDGSQLLLTNGQTLHVSGSDPVWNSSSVLGANAAASNALALVSGAGSFWSNANTLLIGSNGAFNRLVISNGGLVGNGTSYLGAAGTSSNNEALVTGAGSFWSNRVDLYVGGSGDRNRLVISNGGLVGNNNGLFGATSASSNNEALVTGAGSFWSNRADLFVGDNGSFSRLVVSNGGLVGDNHGYLALNSGSSNNEAVVTGAGSLWSNRLDLYVGFGGAANRLVITNGGAVFASNSAVLGSSASSTNNRIVTDGGTLRVARAAGTGLFDLRRGTNVLNAGANDVDYLMMTNAPGIFEFNGGTLITRGGLVSNGAPFVVGANGTTAAIWDVQTGVAGSNVVVASNLVIGLNVPNSQLLVTNGQMLLVQGGGAASPFASAVLGANAGATNALALVSGASSYWSNTLNLAIGSNGGFNQLVVSNGGTVRSSTGFLGFNSTSSNNVAVVTGAGSLWTNASELRVGDSGAGNLLLIANGGTVRNGSGYLGYFPASSNNVAVVTGAGSLWTSPNTLYVGNSGAGNILLITNGGTVRSGASILGQNTTSSNNAAVVTGAGSLWTNSSILYVGISGAGNLLLITNGGTVHSSVGYLAYFPNSSNNVAVITGAGSSWANANDLRVGSAGQGNNILLITNGGTVRSGAGYVGGTSSNNVAVVTGTGSQWTNANGLYVGYDGSSSQLTISDGGTAHSAAGYLGYFSTASNHVAVVTGVGSAWSNATRLYVGYDGPRNTLLVTNGGTVFASNGVYMGFNSTSTNNRIVNSGGNLLVQNATGTGVFDIRRGTNVLNAGTNDMDYLLMTNAAGVFEFNGGLLITRGGFISNGAPSFVVGAGGATPAIWDVRAGVSNFVVSNQLVIGSNVANSRLLITNGGQLLAGAQVTIGLEAPSTGNVAVVAGGGSLWSNAGGILLGQAGAGNTLIVSNGGTVRSVQGLLGYSTTNPPAGSNNVAIVTGSNSLWAVGFAELAVGATSASNRLEVSAGGTVTGANAYVGRLNAPGNVALVTGAGSLWSNSASLTIGEYAAGNQLVVSNGGTVINYVGYVGFGVTLALATNNLATVTGAGSLWSNRNTLAIGEQAAWNRLLISSNGTVFASNAVTLGTAATSTNNRIVNDGGTLRVANNSSNGLFDIRRGTNVLNSGLIDVDQLLMTNAAGIFEFNGGMLITRGGFISNGAPFVVGANGTTPAIWDVRAGGSNVVVTSNLFIGFNVAGSQLLITNGQTLRVLGSTGGFSSALGGNTAGSNNLAIVAGTGSLWANSSDLYVGASGSGNQLIISNGGVVSNAWGLIGLSSTSSNNVAAVTGLGSLWSNAGNLYVGNSGAGNQLIISNGGVVMDIQAILGASSSSSSNNVALVTGAGSQWSNLSLVVGGSGGGNQLIVSNGGVVQGDSDYLGITSQNNLAVVTGAGSLWSNRQDLTVGFNGAANRLLITNGGTVFASNAVYLGAKTPATNNRIDVSGGSLIVSNATGTGVLDVRRGTNSLSMGLEYADQLVVTNTLGKFQFKGGTLRTRGTLLNNGDDFEVGDGSSSALFEMVGTLVHAFSNAFTIRANATASLNSASGGITFGQGVNIDTGGTLIFQAANQIAAGAPLRLNGGTFNLNGNVQTAPLGALTLTANSTLDFGTGGAQVFTLANLASHTTGSILYIQNWIGSPNGGGGSDQVKFADLGASLTPGFLADVHFGGYPDGAILLGTGEIVPVPEPATWAAICALLGLIGWRERRRLARLVRRKSVT